MHCTNLAVNETNSHVGSFVLIFYTLGVKICKTGCVIFSGSSGQDPCCQLQPRGDNFV